ncbi:hypothetical protein [Sulfobacillus thermosulfidooxidans]|uniref:hypothetical protein n=1 Tax=Sulfobacillus thermosulfidooxidans TaxID=28034 RepID=UPI0002F53CAD|nr:hypothetical protein [Sulfobacillus thermosulfidooxidans]OLZ09637.1 hypothetical protein BFX05_11800 [Sulfobacillus thermosulfidooxidans]OLZ16057.1 hypothetical protein BFX06_03240 [Sulfobacillus thermosulfidooxidans]
MSLRNPHINVFAIDLDKARDLLKILSIQTVPTFAFNENLMVLTANEWILAQKIWQVATAQEF